MSKFINPSRKSNKRKDNNNDGFPMPSRKKNDKPGFKKPAPKSGTQGQSASRPAQGKRPIKTFNPQMFIKKVEEQSAPTAATYVPKNSFADFPLDAQIQANIVARGYKSPTPIQDDVITHILDGKDVIATANTGTGKTAAFLIPLVHNVITKKVNKVLIITPTRELAAQIQEELGYFKAKTHLQSVLCIGGVNIENQIRQLKKNPEFVIGTPGRLIDLEDNDCINFSQYGAIVLDEVDTMLDMGFIADIKKIMNKLPKKRHTLFFSATISEDIKGLMAKFLHNPVSVSVKTRQSSENVNQTVVHVDPKNKIEVLHDLLIKPGFTRVIIFLRTKRAVDKLSKSLKARGFDAIAIHGDKTQAHRKKALDLFKHGKMNILLATDVVARGIDIDDVSHVINYDLPQSHEDYIHRIGRTGRASKVGQAITFIEIPSAGNPQR